MEETKITRELITAFGEKLLKNKEVDRVLFDVSFKDGSKIQFSKSKYENIGEDEY